MGKGNDGGGGFIAGFLIGGVIGGLAAVLLTQDALRDQLVGKAREAGNLAMDATGDLREKMSDVSSQWQSSVSEFYERGRQVVESARANIDAAVAEGRAAADETAEELQRKAEG